MLPCLAIAASTPAPIAARSVMSNAATSAVSLASVSTLAALASSSGLRPFRMTVAPACARPRAMAKPSPR